MFPIVSHQTIHSMNINKRFHNTFVTRSKFVFKCHPSRYGKIISEAISREPNSNHRKLFKNILFCFGWNIPRKDEKKEKRPQGQSNLTVYSFDRPKSVNTTKRSVPICNEIPLNSCSGWIGHVNVTKVIFMPETFLPRLDNNNNNGIISEFIFK